MATQTDVQQLIQGLTPSGVNNGNPNTAYNNSPATTGGGAGVPMTDVYGNWFTPQVNPAANYTYGSLDLALTPLPIMPLPVLGNGGGSGTTTPPVVTPPANGGGNTPPPSTGGGGGGGGGIGGGGTATGGGLGTGGGWNVTGPNTITVPKYTGSLGGGTGGSTNYGGGGINLSDIMDNAGNIDWKQVIDAATDVIPGLQGNFYDSTTGQIQWDALAGRLASVLTGTPIPGAGNWYLDGSKTWDASNIGASLLTMLTGLPVNSIANFLGRMGASNGWSDNNLFVDHYMDNVRNNLDTTQLRLNRTREQMLDDYLRSQGNGVMNAILQNNLNSGVSNSNTKMDAILQQIQARIDAAAAGNGPASGGSSGNGQTTSTSGRGGVVSSRPIGGELSYGGGQSGYNNGVGAGTGYGASSYANDSWGTVASGFGVGGMSGGARDQAMPQYKGLK